MGENEPYVLSAVVPQRAHLGSETQFSADNQPEKRGRPPGSRNKMPRVLKEMIVESPRRWGACLTRTGISYSAARTMVSKAS